jgi:type II secretory pathway component PulJ
MLRSLRIAVLAVTLTAGLAATAAVAEEMKLSQTAAEHQAMAKSYEEKVAAWRAEAAYHRDMAGAYKKTHPDRKSGAVNRAAAEMEKHCMNIVTDVEKAAGEADELAKFHHLRAKELEGK